ncbi:hypothetical protein GCM10027046_38180 [Uliginosibacterium flavum]
MVVPGLVTVAVADGIVMLMVPVLPPEEELLELLEDELPELELDDDELLELDDELLELVVAAPTEHQADEA